ncbi:non-ribosomal peptide synthetase [Solwaraspora sp. WMMD1047]|uniref:non-ribosomal peptide synthetase n=1 Tax=Solwaraspora sp. WMMD1047 TaxID=3016102 RepID=UPI002416DD20|nr:non-ribosomal peptide synthetase [Solwaraspora sp. WMMD1047]MDG4829278.1 non-ribosomal peptide synthetase [Solwaraspora sp. WMMD1047]
MGEHFEGVATAFERRVRLHPDKIAIRDPRGSATFDEVWSESNRVAAALRARGVERGSAVGILGVGSRDSIVAMLGSWIVGAHVVPLAPEHPVDRISGTVSAASVRLVVETDAYTLPSGVAPAHERLRQLVEQGQPADQETVPADLADATAYVLFTSGSTGVPKGVCVPQGALCALALRDSPTRLSADDTFLVHTTLTFDPSMLEIWSALLVGAGVLCAPGSGLSLRSTADLLGDDRVTVAVLTPAVFALMVERYPQAIAGLRRLIVGGDIMPVGQARAAKSLCPDVDIVNCYGPTENTVISTAFRLQEWDGTGDAVPIGVAVAGATAHVVDADFRPTAPGVVGELVLGGDRLADGYLQDPATTHARFIPDPFSSLPGARLYRTGDRAARRADGVLEFHGRADLEVKVRGVRVNLTEVESAVGSDPAVAEVVAVPVGSGHERRVVAFVRAADDVDGPDAKGIRTRVAERVPAYLVPDHITFVEEFPLTGSSKVDRDALADRVGVLEHGDGTPQEPSTEDLAAFWLRRTGSDPRAGESFFDAGGNSLDLIRFIDDVGATYGIELGFEDVYGVASFDELRQLVIAAAGERRDG